MLHFVNFARERHNSSSSEESPQLKALKDLHDREESVESAHYFDSISAPVSSSPRSFRLVSSRNRVHRHSSVNSTGSSSLGSRASVRSVSPAPLSSGCEACRAGAACEQCVKEHETSSHHLHHHHHTNNDKEPNIDNNLNNSPNTRNRNQTNSLQPLLSTMSRNQRAHSPLRTAQNIGESGPSDANSDASKTTEQQRALNELEYFHTKEIEWFELSSRRRTKVNILLQNANGPCPLVSLINTLVLTHSEVARYTADKKQISVKGLLEYLGSLIIDKTLNSSTHLPIDFDKDVQLSNDINKVLGLLPKLVSGLHIDPCFDGTFSDSPEMALFRLYDVNIVHGWIADPESEVYNYADLKAAQSYENAQILFIEAAEIRSHKTHLEQQQSQQSLETQGEASIASQGHSVEIPQADVNSPPPPYTISDELSRHNSTQIIDETIETSDAAATSSDASFSTPTSIPSSRRPSTLASRTQSHQAITTTPTTSSVLTETQQETLRRAETTELFLEHYPSQLTEYGLRFLTNVLYPGAVAILFRNDHFSTIFRPLFSTLPLDSNGKPPTQSPLLSLVTDVGLGKQREIVWQSLSSISGAEDTFLDGCFRVPRGITEDNRDRRTADGLQNASQDVFGSGSITGFDEAHQLQSESEKADYEMARQMQLEEDEQLAARMQKENERIARERHAQTSSRQQQQQAPVSNQQQSLNTPSRQHTRASVATNAQPPRRQPPPTTSKSNKNCTIM